MTLAEIVLLCLLAAAIYRALRPLERRLELWIYRQIAPKTGSKKPDIEIKETSKWK